MHKLKASNLSEVQYPKIHAVLTDTPEVPYTTRATGSAHSWDVPGSDLSFESCCIPAPPKEGLGPFEKGLDPKGSFFLVTCRVGRW